MMNGSTRGSVSSYNSARSIRTGNEIEKAQHAVAPLQVSRLLELEQPRDHAVRRVEHQRVQRAPGARTIHGGILRQGQLEEGVELHTLTAAARVLEQRAAGPDVAGAGPDTVRRSGGRAVGKRVQHPEIPLAQVPAAVGDTVGLVEQAIEAHQRVGAGAGVHHVELEGVVEARVHQLYGEPHARRRGGADALRHLVQPAHHLSPVLSERVARQRGGKVDLQEQRWLAPRRLELPRGVAAFRVAKRLRQARQMLLDRGNDRHPARPGDVAARPYEGEILLERAIPAPAFPRHGPSEAAVPRRASLHLHPRLVDRPGGHGLGPGLVLSDHSLEHDERQARGRVLLQLAGVQGELTGTLADRVGDGATQVAGGQIDAIGVADVVGEVAGPLAFKALEIALQPLARHPPTPAPARASRTARCTASRSSGPRVGPQGSSQASGGSTPSAASAHSMRRTYPSIGRTKVAAAKPSSREESWRKAGYRRAANAASSRTWRSVSAAPKPMRAARAPSIRE